MEENVNSLLNFIIAIVAAFCTGGGLFTFIIFMIKRKDAIKEKNNAFQQHIDISEKRFDELDKKIDNFVAESAKANKETELRLSRLQLITLIKNYPKSYDAIFSEANHYFVECGGDGWMHPKFNEWLAKEKLEDPEWYKRENKSK